MSIKTLFSAQAADASSTAYKVREQPGNAAIEQVAATVYGTWNSATVTFETCWDINASPQQWTTLATPVLQLAAFVSDLAINLELMSGTWLRATVSGAGSPAPSLTVKVSGDLATS